MHQPRLFLTIVPLFVMLCAEAFGATIASRERAAMKACLNGNPEKGVHLLTDLFVDTGDLAYIFNQGRCFEQNRRYEDAIGRFREYLIKGTELSRDGKADAEKHIATCESYLRKAEPEPVPATEARQPAPPPPEPPKKAEAIPAAEPTHVAEPTQVLVQSPPSGLRCGMDWQRDYRLRKRGRHTLKGVSVNRCFSRSTITSAS